MWMALLTKLNRMIKAHFIQWKYSFYLKALYFITLVTSNTFRPNSLCYINKMWINLPSLYIRTIFLETITVIIQEDENLAQQLQAKKKKKNSYLESLEKAFFSDYIVSSAKLVVPDPVTAF